MAKSGTTAQPKTPARKRAAGSPAPAPKKPLSPAARRFWRVAMTLGGLGLVVWLGMLLFTPFWHPRTHLILLTGDFAPGQEQLLAAPPLEYVVEDLSALTTLADVLHQGLFHSEPTILGHLRSRDHMERLEEQLETAAAGSTDVLILYVAAHGVTDEGVPYLTCTQADPQSPLSGRYRVANLLRQLRDCPAPVKILLLDAGHVEHDPARGMALNDFPALLREEVLKTGDPRLWVLCSHSTLEKSQLSHTLKRSIFNYFVVKGLRGAADINQDRSIDLRELERYVSVNVSAWVREISGGQATQTPLLAWGGGSELPRTVPTLLAVSRKADAEIAVTPLEEIRASQAPPAAGQEAAERGKSELRTAINQQIMKSAPSGKVGQVISDKASQFLDASLGKAGAEPAAPEDAAAGEKGAAEKGADKSKETDSKVAADPAAAKDEKASGEKAGEPAAAKPEVVVEPVATDEPAAPLQSAAQLLSQAWQLRDDLLSPGKVRDLPLEYAPHLWRTLEAELLAYEQRLDAGLFASEQEISVPLTELVASLQKLLAGAPAAQFSEETLLWQIAQARPMPLVTEGKQAHSAAMQEYVAQHGGEKLPSDAVEALAKLDKLMAFGDGAQLAALSKSLESKQDRWSELRLVSQLAPLSEVVLWSTLEALLRCNRLGEQTGVVAADALPWIQPQLDEADTLLAAARRIVLDGVGPEAEDAPPALARAAELYTTAQQDAQMIAQARQLAAQLTRKAPYYVQWRASIRGSDSAFGPAYADLAELLRGTRTLTKLLAQPQPAELPELRKLVVALEEKQTLVERHLHPKYIHQLAMAPIRPGDAWRIETLLATPLLPAAERAKLRQALATVEATLAEDIALPDVSRADLPNKSMSSTDYRLLARQVELEVLLLQLALKDDAVQWLVLSAARRELDARQAEFERSPGNSNAAARLQQAHAKLGGTLRDIYRQLPAQIAQSLAVYMDLSRLESRLNHEQQLQHLNAALAMVDPRDIQVVRQAAPFQELSRARMFDLLAWQHQRLAPAQKSEYQQLAQFLVGQPPLGLRASLPLEMTGPASLSLALQEVAEVEFTLEYHGAAPQSAWLLLRYDPEILSIHNLSEAKVYRQTTVRSSPLPTNPLRAEGDLLEPIVISPLESLARATSTHVPSVRVRPGDKVLVRLRVTRLGNSPRPAKLTVQAILENRSVESTLAVGVPSPSAVQVVVKGSAGTWTSGNSGTVLHPFPNRTTDYQLFLHGNGSKERKVNLEIFQLPASPQAVIPQHTLSAEDANSALAALSLGAPLAMVPAITLPADGSAVEIPFPVPGKAPPSPEPKPAGAAAAEGAPMPPAATGPPLGTPVERGFLLVLSDLETSQKTFHQLDIMPQRPSRYVHPRVGYSQERGRIEILVQAQEVSLLPPDGAKVSVQLEEPLSTDAEARTDGLLSSSSPQAEMYIEVASEPGKVVTLLLDVDSFPRAFVYRVPCSANMTDIAPESGLLRVAVSDLPAGAVFKAPAEKIPVKLQVDVPANAFQGPDDRVEIGVDRDRDREFRGETTLRLTAERQVKLTLGKLAPRGLMSLQTEIGDFDLILSDAGKQSGKANVLAKAVVGDRVAWSVPREIILDSAAPLVRSVALQPDRVIVIGADLNAFVLATDEELSGVASVEALIDVKRTGTFPVDGKPIPAKPQADGAWLAKLPTGDFPAGPYNLLLRAIDNQGNISEVTKLPIQIITLTEADGEGSKLAQISGQVVYGEKPLPGVKVSLKLDKVEKPRIKTTDDQGKFVFNDVPPGKHQVKAEGLVKNKNRKLEIEVIAAPPAKIDPLRLKLP